MRFALARILISASLVLALGGCKPDVEKLAEHMDRAGAFISSTETVIFQLLDRAN